MEKILNTASLLVLSLSGYTIFSIYQFEQLKSVQISNPYIVSPIVNPEENDETPSFIEDAIPTNTVEKVLSTEEIETLMNDRDPYHIPKELEIQFDDFVTETEFKKEEELKKELALEIQKKEEEARKIMNANAQKHVPTIETFSALYDVNKFLIYALIDEGSSFEENYINGEDEEEKIGLMQINPNIAKTLASELGMVYDTNTLLNPIKNIQLGTFHLKKIRSSIEDIHFVINAFKDGEEKVKKDFETNKTYKTTFSKSVVKKIAYYEQNSKN